MLRSLIKQIFLGIIAKFIVEGTEAKWSFLWRREITGSTRGLHEIFSMILDPTHGTCRYLEFGCNAIATARFSSNVLNCAQWDPLNLDVDFLSKIIGPFEPLTRKPFDMKYCVGYLDKEVGLALIPRNLVGSQTFQLYYHRYVKILFFILIFDNDPMDCRRRH